MDSRLDRRGRRWWIVVITGLTAVASLVVINNLLTRPIEAHVIDSSVTPLGDDRFEAEIRWSFRTTPEEPESARVVISGSELSKGAVLVWRDGRGGFTLDDPTYQPTVGDYFLAGTLGVLLGLVMVMTIRGFGYVRGTGEPGSKPAVDVAEDRGFYWRT